MVLCVLFLYVADKIPGEDNKYSHTYVHQALAFTKGSVSLDMMVPDAAVKDGRYYVAFPPFPAVVLTPFVYLFGASFKTLVLTPFLGALTALAALRLGRALGASRDVALWMTAGLVLGTSLLLCIRFPVDTFFAHCCAVLFAFAALAEAFGKRRGLWIGFALGAAVLSRQMMIFTVPFVWAILILTPKEGSGRGSGLGQAAWTLVGLATCAGLYLWFNWIRFGSPAESGYAYLREGGWYGYRAERWGDFSWLYVPSNLIRLFLTGPDIQFQGPSYLVPQMGNFGTSLTYASPFLFYAVRGRLPGGKALNAIAWLSIGLACGAILSHKSALGGWQINGLRYTLDFIPMVFVLAVLGLERAGDTGYQRLGKALVVYSIVLNLVAMAVIPLAARLLGALPH